MLENYDIGSKVVFEIVESEFIENFEGVINFINHVKKYKCKIAIDDFGTGYSNFEYLIKLKADFLKIDGSLIRNLERDDNARIVVSTIVEFSKRKQRLKIVESETNKLLEQEKKYNDTWKKGECTFGDMDITRHKNTPYQNDFPCGNKCTSCGTFWID